MFNVEKDKYYIEETLLITIKQFNLKNRLSGAKSFFWGADCGEVLPVMTSLVQFKL